MFIYEALYWKLLQNKGRKKAGGQRPEARLEAGGQRPGAESRRRKPGGCKPEAGKPAASDLEVYLKLDHWIIGSK